MSFWTRETKLKPGGPDVNMAELFRLSRRTIAITGGSGALGLAMAEAIVESGADVILMDLAEAEAKSRQRLGVVAIKQGAKVLFQSCDVTSESSVKNAFDHALPLMDHPLRGLVCCAGISGDGPSIDWPVNDWRRIHDINVLGTFLCAREAARRMRDHGISSGSMVLIASMSGHGVNKGVDTAAYNASKAAVQQTARSLASEWGSNKDMPLIRVNSVSPGYILTRLTANTLQKPGIKRQWESDNMLMRLSTVDEYRGAIVFLLSDASSFVTGTDIRVDGGHTAW